MALTKVTSGGLDGTFPDDSIVNADINSSAAIALSKLATDPSNATNLASGTVPTARLGSGTASSSTVLYGDQTYKAEPGGGKILQITRATPVNGQFQTTSSTLVNGNIAVVITPSATSSKILVSFNTMVASPAASAAFYDIQRAISGGTTTDGIFKANSGSASQGMGGYGPEGTYVVMSPTYLDEPSTTSEITYTFMLGRWWGSGTISQNDNATIATAWAMEIDGS